jgi:hypothetical protein
MKTLKNIFMLLTVFLAATSTSFAADDNLIKGVPNDYLLYGALGTMVFLLVTAILSLVVVFYINAPQLFKNAK